MSNYKKNPKNSNVCVKILNFVVKKLRICSIFFEKVDSTMMIIWHYDYQCNEKVLKTVCWCCYRYLKY